MSWGAVTANAPELSVVISTLGNYVTLGRVLDGYDRQNVAPGTFEVVVVSDAADPDPDTIDSLLERREFPVRRLSGLAPGLSANRNTGWRAARAPLVLFTDNDTIPVRRLVGEHLSWHRRNPEPEAGVLGRVRWARELDVTTFMRWLDMGIQFDYWNIKGTDAGWGRFTGANVSLKRSFVGLVGDFDQDHFPYGYEDTDWAYRASKLGFRLHYNRRAVVDHLRPMTVEFWQKRARRVAAAEYMFHKLHPELTPWFYEKFREEMRMPPVRGRGLPLAPFVSPRVPWLGNLVWRSVDRTYKRALGPHFLAAWEEAANGAAERAQPDLSEFASEATAGTEEAGPK